MHLHATARQLQRYLRDDKSENEKDIKQSLHLSAFARNELSGLISIQQGVNLKIIQKFHDHEKFI